MADYVQSSPHWESVNEADVQSLANQGVFVLAVWKNPSGPGHVGVVAPLPPDFRPSDRKPYVRDGNLHPTDIEKEPKFHSTYGAVPANKAFPDTVVYYRYAR